MHLKENYFLCAKNPILHANCASVQLINLYSAAPLEMMGVSMDW